MSDNNVVEEVVEEVPEDVPEDVKEMPPKKESEATTPVITNPEPVVDTPKVNKKLSTMSKNTKEKQKNRKLSKPTVSTAAKRGQGFSLDINPMYLFGLLGVIIAGASLWYQRKSFLKESGSDKNDDNDNAPVQSTGGEEETKSPPKKKQKQNDPWAYQREHQQTGIFPGNYDFD